VAQELYASRPHARQHGPHPRPSSWDELHQQGKGVAGSPATVADFCREQMQISQCNYMVGQFAFGDQTLEEMESSITLFAREVMPKLHSC
jgi:hypothetical protein